MVFTVRDGRNCRASEERTTEFRSSKSYKGLDTKLYKIGRTEQMF